MTAIEAALSAPPDAEIVAAIAAAIAYLRHRAGVDSGLGASLQAGRGGWWQAGHPARTPSMRIGTAQEMRGEPV